MGNSHVCGLNPRPDDTGTGDHERPMHRFNWRLKRHLKFRFSESFGEGDDRANSYAPSDKCDEPAVGGISGERQLDNDLFINSNNNTPRLENVSILPHEVTAVKFSNRGVNTGGLPIQFHHSRPLNKTDVFIKAIRNWVPGATHMERIFLRRRLRRTIPYISGTVLGFSKLKKELDEVTLWLRPRRKVEHWMRYRLGSPPPHYSTLLDAQTNSPMVGSGETCEKKTNEKEDWWRYTMFIPVDPLDKPQIKRRLNEHGGYLVGLESRFGCEIKFTDKIYVYRANVVRLAVIDGPSKKAILRCKSALPAFLTKDLIQDFEDCPITDPKPPARKLNLVNATLPPGVQVN